MYAGKEKLPDFVLVEGVNALSLSERLAREGSAVVAIFAQKMFKMELTVKRCSFLARHRSINVPSI